MQALAQKKGLIIGAAVAVAVLGGGALAYRAHMNAQRDANEITANGTIEADEVEIGAQRPAKLMRYFVAEGQAVTQGQVIAELDTSELNAQLKQAKAAEDSAAARLKELQLSTRSEDKRAAAAVAQARASLDGARRSMGNAQLGYKRRTTFRIALDAAETQLKTAREGVRQADASVRGAEEALRIAEEDKTSTVPLRTARDLARQQFETAQEARRGAQAQLELVMNGAREEDVRAAQAAAAQADATLIAARDEMSNANSDLRRMKELHAGKAISDQQLDAAQTRYDTARSRMVAADQGKEQAQQRLKALQVGSRPEEKRSAQAAAAQADRALEGAKRSLDNAEEALQRQLGPRGTLEGAKTSLQVATAQRDSARAALAGAERGYADAKTAHQDALPDKQALDTARMQYEASLAQLDAAQAALDLRYNGAAAEQIKSVRAQLLQAKGAAEMAQTQHSQSVITAPENGVITKEVAKVGEVVNPGATVARLVPLDKAYLTLYVPLTYLGKIQLGQRVEVTADTYPNRKYEGKVTYHSDTPEFTPRNVQTRDERVKLVFQVKVTVDNRSKDLKPGMPADATIYLR
jgi:HlyD family secretion protein